MLKVRVDDKAVVYKLRASRDMAPRALDSALEEIARRIQGRAIRKAPVRTGTLRRSIGLTKAGALHYRVYTNLFYAPYVELGIFGRGKVKRPQKAFMRPAMLETEPEVNPILRRAANRIKGA